MSEIPAKNTKRLNGNESITNDGVSIGIDVADFWSWSSSELLGNALRGKFAEYIVSLDLCSEAEVREEWDAYDLVTKEGIKVEVKSASLLQSWEQNSLSPIIFGIRPTRCWDATLRRRGDVLRRQADYYVFCVLAHGDMPTVDPLELSQWNFYVLPTAVLDSNVPDQKTISLNSLMRFSPKKCVFGRISDVIQEYERGK